MLLICFFFLIHREQEREEEEAELCLLFRMYGSIHEIVSFDLDGQYRCYKFLVVAFHFRQVKTKHDTQSRNELRIIIATIQCR